MGYDMTFRKADPDEAAAVEEAEEIFYAACSKRDALPEAERGTLNMEGFLPAGLGEDAYAGSSPRYRAAVAQVRAAYAALEAAQKSYFRLNISGMGWARGVMERLGMAFEDPTERPEWPDPGDYGTSWEALEALEYPEDCPGFAWTDEARRAAVKFREARERVLSWHGAEIPGIPLHKFSSNDGWIVLPAEAEAAVRIWKQKYDEMGEDRARAVVVPGGSAGSGRADAYWSLWLRWVDYLADSVRHGGFEVR